VFSADIKNLLTMSDMCPDPCPPLPLDFETIMDGTLFAALWNHISMMAVLQAGAVTKP